MSDSAVRMPVLTWALALLGLGAIAIALAWTGWLVAVLLVVTAVVPLLVLRLTLRLGISRWASSLVISLLIMLIAYLLAARSGASLTESVRDAVPRLLTQPQPYQVRADLLVAPVLLVGLVSVLVGLRLGSRTRVEPVAGAALLYLAGALLTSGSGDPWALLAVLIVVVAFAGWVLLDEHSEPARARVAVAAPVAVIAVGALAALALVPAAHPFEPRDLVDPPVVRVEAVSPLPQLGAWAADPDAELLRVSGDAVPLRLVVLDRYDGAQWRAATGYAPFGTLLDPTPPPGDERVRLRQQVTFVGLGGNWLPTPGDPIEIDLSDALVDPRSGTLFSPTPTTGLTYSVSGLADDPDKQRLLGARAPVDDTASRYLQLPALPAPLQTYSRAVTEGIGDPYARALAIESKVRSDRELSGKSVSGSALWRISAFLLGREGTPGGRIGTSEQFATAFALIARDNGLPTRLVVGFRPGELQPDGTRIIRGGDAMAWPEVYFSELGWVPFAPTPDDDTFSQDRPPESQLPQPSESSSPAPASSQPDTAGADDHGSEESASSGQPWLRYAVGPLAVVGVLGLLALLRWRRTRAQRRRGARGSWAEIVDSLHLARIPPEPHLSAPVIARDLEQRLGVAGALLVAERADEDAFGPAPTSGEGLVAEVREVRRAARGHLPWWRRWWWAFDPRVLRR